MQLAVNQCREAMRVRVLPTEFALLYLSSRVQLGKVALDRCAEPTLIRASLVRRPSCAKHPVCRGFRRQKDRSSATEHHRRKVEDTGLSPVGPIGLVQVAKNLRAKLLIAATEDGGTVTLRPKLSSSSIQLVTESVLQTEFDRFDSDGEYFPLSKRARRNVAQR